MNRASLLTLLTLTATPAFASPSITVSKPWMRYLLQSIPAAGYMTIHNNGDSPAVLTAAASPSCGMLMLHESQDKSGMSMMMDVPSVTIPAHGSVTFAPGGYHLMCMSPAAMKPGSDVSLTLTFQGGATIPVTAPVYGAQSSP